MLSLPTHNDNLDKIVMGVTHELNFIARSSEKDKVEGTDHNLYKGKGGSLVNQDLFGMQENEWIPDGTSWTTLEWGLQEGNIFLASH